MGYLLLVLTAIVAVNCDKGSKTFNIKGFEPYYMGFTMETGVKARNLVIQFGDTSRLGPSTAGICGNYSGIPTVTIRKEFWDRSQEDMRHLLIYHELGHCLLGRGHNTGILPSGLPGSIMHPRLFDPEIIKKNHNYYIRELLHGGESDRD